VSQYQKHKTNLDFTEARDSEWQWHQLGHMQVCTLLIVAKQINKISINKEMMAMTTTKRWYRHWTFGLA